MFVCVCVCVCVCVGVCMYVCADTCDLLSIFKILFKPFLIYHCMCVYVCVFVRVCEGGWACVLCLSVGVRNRSTTWALETSHLKRDVLFFTCEMWSMVIFVIWPLFRKMPANQKPLNRIGIFRYQFTPRQLLYHMVSVNLVNFGPYGLSVFFFFFFWRGGGGTLYRYDMNFEVILFKI